MIGDLFEILAIAIVLCIDRLKLHQNNDLCDPAYQHIKRPPVLMRRYSIQRYYLTLMKIPFLAVIMNMIKCVNGSKTKIVL